MQWLYTTASSSSNNNNRTNHKHLNDYDVVQASVSTSHTLPLPNLRSLIKRELVASKKSNNILPTPEDANKKFAPKGDSERPPGIASGDHSRTPGVAYCYDQTTSQRSMHNSYVHCPNLSRPDRNMRATMATVHLLPLPPGAAGLPYSSSLQTINKPDLVAKTPRQSQWKKGKLIGRGTFGSVYVGSNRETGALCAMKEAEILPDDPKSAESIKQLQQEIDVLSKLKHPNIVQYYGSEIVEDRFYIYMEYVHPGSVNKYVRDHCGGMTESIVRNFTRHIVSGLAYLHSAKTIHRDIEGANLLVDANGVVKLADFGMAKHLDGQVILSLKGSPYWNAPELLQGEPQKDGSPDLALAVDIWSLVAQLSR